MTADERLAFIRSTAETRNQSHRDLTPFTLYRLGWFIPCDSPSNRHVSARAVDRPLVELDSRHGKGSQHWHQLDKAIRALALTTSTERMDKASALPPAGIGDRPRYSQPVTLVGLWTRWEPCEPLHLVDALVGLDEVIKTMASRYVEADDGDTQSEKFLVMHKLTVIVAICRSADETTHTRAAGNTRGREVLP
ncbi:hypothetical protein D3879_22300 [Pseudomonas cavernicola]|uniref:Uncharacterized protein n=2 Tax=Pseudomonas cavernicola TaxID=2320866 RepID=A0A418X8C6_9PSED|nr:hypothetical protein [Pseudomonas cavernicola]RJG08623.1 hypothetical protein D3879_22225 [Pseudomonas cavernicola]RJG08629.1 hypothetical protein D3879_22300 [Pseudomonas cavernicola]